MARLALEADGFVVVGTATDGESAVAEVLRLRPDIVLLDVGLPDMTGFEVASRLREAASSCCDRARLESRASPTSGRSSPTRAPVA